jgi:hypothetical protein
VKERPILFSGPMVRAILDGRKTQTRRVVNPQPDSTNLSVAYTPSNHDPRTIAMKDGRYSIFCPYGRPGDRLWVRETWRTWRSLDHCKPSGLAEGAAIAYEADGRTNINNHEAGPLIDAGRIRQSIFMRKWMSRITLEITGIRVKRLQDINPHDALAEGIYLNQNDWWECGNGLRGEESPTAAYRALWETINGPGSWAANPFVWVIEFTPVTP